jgi:hypothetical protein
MALMNYYEYVQYLLIGLGKVRYRMLLNSVRFRKICAGKQLR